MWLDLGWNTFYLIDIVREIQMDWSLMDVQLAWAGLRVWRGMYFFRYREETER